MKQQLLCDSGRGVRRCVKRAPSRAFVWCFCAVLIGGSLLLQLPGCWRNPARSVVVYTALDAEFSEPILTRFSAATGVQVQPNFDVESTKTVGLVTRIIRERERPRCDVFWNNEILHTLRLQQLGLLAQIAPSTAARLPEAYRSRDGLWFGLAARARVLIVNTDVVPIDKRPESIRDLVDPQWRQRVGIAKPLFGTTATHAAVLVEHWGMDRAHQYFASLRDNAQVLSGNRQVALEVGRGKIAFGITDTDDAIREKEKGHPVAIIYPDQRPTEMGTLFIPNTVAVLKNCPHPAAARQLVEYLLSSQVETALARGPSAQFPVNPDVEVCSRAAPATGVRWMKVDFEAAARHWDATAKMLRALFVDGS